MGKSSPSVTFDQVDVSRQEVKVGSGEEVTDFNSSEGRGFFSFSVSDSGGNVPFPPLSPSPPCPGQVAVRW